MYVRLRKIVFARVMRNRKKICLRKNLSRTTRKAFGPRGEAEHGSTVHRYSGDTCAPARLSVTPGQVTTGRFSCRSFDLIRRTLRFASGWTGEFTNTICKPIRRPYVTAAPGFDRIYTQEIRHTRANGRPYVTRSRVCTIKLCLPTVFGIDNAYNISTGRQQRRYRFNGRA